MADAARRQGFRKIALVFGYALVASFGVAAMLIMEDRPLDERGYIIIAIIGSGAFLGAALTMLYAKRILHLSNLPRFIAAFFSVMLATFVIQGLLSGAYTIVALADRGMPENNDAADMSFSYAYGFAYYVIYGSPLAWPVGLGAAFLFALGFLTLRAQNDTNEQTRRVN